MFRVIGKRVGLMGLAAEDADRLMGDDFGDALIGLLLLHAPDGLILQEHGTTRVWETIRGERVVFDPGRSDWTNQPGGYAKEPERSRREWRELIQAEAKAHARFIQMHGGSNGNKRA